MTQYAAFLRGVNVGGVNLKMAEVATALTDAGLAEVRTILATGNVRLESAKGADAVRATAEKALRQQFGYDAWVLVYPIKKLQSIVDGYPFEPEIDGFQSYVTFVSDTDVLDELASTRGRCRREDRTRSQVGRRDLLAGRQEPHAGQHHRQDDGQEEVQVVNHHAQSANAGEGAGGSAVGVGLQVAQRLGLA